MSCGTAPPSSSLLAMRTSAPAGSSTGSGPKLTRQTKRSPRWNASDAVGGGQPVQSRAASPHGAVAPQPQPGAVELEHRGRRRRSAASTVSGAQSRGLLEPGGRAVAAEAVRRSVAGPGERDTAAVAAGVDAARAEPHRVLAALGRDVLDLGQPELLALVDVHRAGQRHREERRRAGAACAACEVGRGSLRASPRTRTTCRRARSG